MKYYISDLHIGHANCIAFDERPFFTLEEMHETMIERWNSVVTKNDDVYILGDVAWHNPTGVEVLKKMNGNKFLILGNHDRVNPELKEQFVWVKDYAIIKDGGAHVVLCHYPLAVWRSSDYGYIHLYGHIHKGRDVRPIQEFLKIMKDRDIPHECHNVGCMMPYMDYTPRTLQQIREMDK